MNTAIASSSGGNEGIGFTIPINMVMIVARQLVEHGSVVRAFLGVKLDAQLRSGRRPTSVGLKRPRGARITARHARLAGRSWPSCSRRRDSWNSTACRVENDSHLINLVSLTEVGNEVPLVVFRDRKLHTDGQSRRPCRVCPTEAVAE